jgi:hypothetical protein
VFQSIVGDVVITAHGDRERYRLLLIDAATDPLLCQRFSAVIGGMMRRLAREAEAPLSIEIDVEPVLSTPDTLWLRHLSDETYAFAEGEDLGPDDWEIVGRGFRSSRLHRHLFSGLVPL